MTDIKQYEPLWGSWYVDEQLGEGSFGKVYKVHKKEFENLYYSAVKMLSIPQSEAEIAQARLSMPEITIPTFFRGFVVDIVQEINFMNAFKGNTNIVSIEDHKIVRKDDLHWDILIRMELLQSLSLYMIEHPLSHADVIQVGIDISHALELCALRNIIHRDIKPDNIFVSEYRNFKLGDFGVARRIERKNDEKSQKGTRTYMAPEVFRGDKDYGPTVDLYSLGIVMYRYLNNNRIPFMPPYPEQLTSNSHEDAIIHRMNSKEPVPEIPNITPELNDFLLKACAFHPKDRFKDATEFRTELEKIAGVEPKAPVHEIIREPVKKEGRKTRPTRRENDERTTGVFVLKREETIAQPKDERPQVPAKITNIIAGAGAVCSGILTLLCLFSGNIGDVFASMPLYAMCAALCVLNFRHAALNLITIVWLVCFLAFSALIDFTAFSYPLFSLLLGIISVEALRSRTRKYRNILCITLAVCGIVSWLLTYLTVRGSQVVSYRELYSAAYAVPLMMFITAVLVMLPNREDGRILAGLSALEIMPLTAFIVLIFCIAMGINMPVMFNIANANLVGFSHEKFSWWRYGRILGLLLQVIASECLLFVAAARMIPEDFLGMLANRKRAVIVFFAGVLITALGIFLTSLM